MILKILPAVLLLLILTSCAPPERPTEPTTAQQTANPTVLPDNQVVLTTLDDAKVVIKEVHFDPVTSVTISVLTPNNPPKLIDKFDAYLYNVCRVRSTEGDELLVVSLLGGTSQGYHLCIYHLDSNLKKVLDTTARPSGYTFLPEFITNNKSLTIQFESYDDHSTQTYVWNPDSKELEQVVR